MGTLLEVRRLGRVAYVEAHALQEALVAERVADLDVPDRLLLLQHEPIVTVGRSPRSEKRAELEAILTCPVVEIERGGEATWHGPGQLVAYPILYLPEGRRDLHAYLRQLEEVVLVVLDSFGVAGRREVQKTGVWIGPEKVASLGVAVRRWVTWHGVSLNLDNSLAPFRSFHPCGLDGSVMTRLCDHLGTDTPTMAQLEAVFEAAFRKIFPYPAVRRES